MTPTAYAWFLPIPLFLVGSIPTGYLIGKACGIDIRQHGSGNIGATNVGRVLGRDWGFFAFTCDFLKGCVPLLIVRWYFIDDPTLWSNALLLVLCGLAAIIGHNYTPWLGFKGGKGIATSAGVLAAILPWSLLVVFSTWGVTVLITRTVSIGSILAAVLLPIVTLWFYPGQWIYFGLALLAGVLATWRHRSNIQRLIAGTEPRLGAKAEKQA